MAENIIANGRKFKDEVKGVWLYEDVKYQSKQEDSVSNTETRKMRMESGPHQVTVNQNQETETEEGRGKRRRKAGADDQKEAKEQKKKDTDHQQLSSFKTITFNFHILNLSSHLSYLRKRPLFPILDIWTKDVGSLLQHPNISKPIPVTEWG